MAKGRLVVVDGSWLAFRAFFAIPPRLATTTGVPTNAVYGFATMFRKLFAGRRPTHGAVCFDAPGPRRRDEQYPAYKANRGPMPPDLAAQWASIERVVAANGFTALRLPGYEADDLIGTYARLGREAGLDVLVVGGDKDFAQLVDDEVRMYDPVKDVTYDPVLVKKRWGVTPGQIVDLLALVGDTSDNIPGVAGIGDKGAVQLLTDHGTLDGVIAAADQLPARARTALLAHLDDARLSRQLATIDRHAPVAGIDTLVVPEPDPRALDALYRELEFASLITTTDDDDAGPDVPVVDDVDAFAAIAAGPLAVFPLIDPPEHGGLAGLALAGDGLHYVPFAHASPALRAAVLAWLADPACPKHVHDAKRLWLACARLGGALAGVAFDTMLASFLVEPERAIPHRLDQVAREYLQRALPPQKRVTGAGKAEVRFADADRAVAARWAGAHAQAIADLTPVLEPRIDEMGQREQLGRDLALSWVLGGMEYAGIYADPADLERMGVEFATRRDALEAQIHALAGHPFNVGSTQQLGTVLFEELRLPVIKKNKTGWSTDAEVLERLAPKHEIARLVLDHRTLSKLINTYTDVLRQAVSPIDGRIHAVFQQTVGVSGRIISTDPDLQRTPIRTPEGRRIRRAFVAPPGQVMISADWSQIELRVLAHFSRDPRLIEAYRTRADVHRQTAAELFGVTPEAVDATQRNVGKTVNFATIYGQGATALGQILGVPRKEAQGYIERFFGTYAGVRAWLDETIREAAVCGYVTTLLGRRRVIPQLQSHDPQDRAAGERIAANTPIQGSAADLCKLAMLAIDRELSSRGSRARMLLQVHDELVFECPPDEVADVTAIIREAMTHPHPLDVPLEVEIGVGPTWGDAH